MGLGSVEGPDSPLCGSCWILEYGNNARPMLVLDGADSGFITTIEAMDYLTDGKAKELGRADVKATQVDLLNCGISMGPPEKEL